MTDRRRRLSTMLELALTELDIPAHLRARAIAEYEAAGKFLDDHFRELGRSGCEVYPQGSFRLGTVIRPLRGDDYDIDLVCRRNVLPSSTTRAALKDEVGDALASFIEQRQDPPRIDEGNRCWTLGYEQQFHMDVLPSLPDPEGSDNAIILTDKSYARWLHSNPIDYASWFRGSMTQEIATLRAIAAARVNANVEDIPEDEVSTTLQRAVQLLKRHRDVYFDRTDEDDFKPPSIILTTLAARAYAGGGEFFDVVAGIASRMADHVEDRGVQRWVPNPVEPDENFADKWATDPRLERAFWRWLAQLRRDLQDLDSGPDDPASGATLVRLERMLGEEPVQKAVGLRRAPVTGVSQARTGEPGEQFIEDRFPVALEDDVRVTCRVGRRSGFRDGLLSSMGYRVAVGRSLTFKVTSCTVAAPYDVYWKIKNKGAEARRAGQLRGEIVRDAGASERVETTRYRGEHYVECYVVKDGVVRARTRHRVVIT